MCEFKLTYFDIKCRAEPIRILFAYAGVKYEDKRLPYTPQLPAELKEQLPFGQLPILEFGDTVLSQSVTIARFLAKRFNLYGKDDWEAAKIDEIMEAITDYGASFGAIHEVKDEEAKEQARKNVIKVTTPRYLGRINEMLQHSVYLVGDSVTLADFVVFNFVTYVGPLVGMDLVKDYPALQAHVKLIEQIPQVQEWVEKRPKTVF